MTQALAARGVPTVRELQRAWAAVRGGDPGDLGGGGQGLGADWSPENPVITVVGCLGSVGATTLAVALAEAGGGASRVVDCSPAARSGLAAAATAELGCTAGWSQGRRGRLILERIANPVGSPLQVPLPSSISLGALGLTVLDVGWDVGVVLAGQGWLVRHLARGGPLVVVTTATVPGVRHLDACLDLLAGHRASPPNPRGTGSAAPTSGAVVVAAVGPAPGRWARQVRAATGPRVAALVAAERVIEVPYVPALQINGLDGEPLSSRVAAAAIRIVSLLSGPRPGPARRVGRSS